MRSLDGISLLPFALDPSRRGRRAVLLEDFTGVPRSPGESSSRIPHAYTGVRVGRYKYVQYASGERELYDLRSDPYELRSLAGERRYRDVVAWMAARTRELASCSGESCRRSPGPIPKPRR
jgi:N-acetylglucosamine-6-sulfatase